MSYQLKPVKCENCKWFRRHREGADGICSKDENFTTDYSVCNKLPTNQLKRMAKINLYG